MCTVHYVRTEVRGDVTSGSTFVLPEILPEVALASQLTSLRVQLYNVERTYEGTVVYFEGAS